MRWIWSLTAAVMLVGGCAGFDETRSDEAQFSSGDCDVGVYGPARAFLTITRRGDDLRYRYSDGRSGRIGDEDAPVCGIDAVRIDQAVVWDKRPITITDTVFESDGVLLAGQLLEPMGVGPQTPLVVLAHGSEELGWIEAVSYPYQFVGRGVSVFVYDKRGTGRSGGAYSQNFPELADDLVAASAEAKRVAGNRFGRFGLFGFSQGGWIAPLAADRSGAEFIGIGYGLVVDIIEEDAAQVALELSEAGYGDEVLAKAAEITSVTARLAVSGYSDGLEDLDKLRDLYDEEEWYPIVRGGFTGVILGMSTSELSENGIPMFDRLNIDWTIKPMDVLRTVDVPQLWALAENDREAPVAKTLERLQMLRTDGKDISIYMFPETDHGMWEYDQMSNGGRETTRITDGYYDLLADWAKGALKPQYAMSEEY